MPKTNSDYCRDYRQRKKNQENKTKKVAKSSTERVREFRARKKEISVKNKKYNVLNNASTIQSNNVETVLMQYKSLDEMQEIIDNTDEVSRTSTENNDNFNINESQNSPSIIMYTQSEDSNMKIDLGKEAIVYTTRLNDMRYFSKKDVSKLNIADFVKSVIQESKPIFRKKYDYKPSASYKNFTIRLKKINKRIKSIVVISDEETQNEAFDSEMFLNGHESTSASAGRLNNLALSSSHKNDMEAHNERNESIGSMLAPTNLIVAITCSNEIDIYYCNRDGYIIQYDFYKGQTPKVEKMLCNPVVKKIRQNFCCWYQREHILTQMFKIKLDIPNKKFLKKCHYCEPNDCRCCCRNSNFNRFLIKGCINLGQKLNEGWFNLLFDSLQLKSSDIIIKALNFSPHEQHISRISNKKTLLDTEYLRLTRLTIQDPGLESFSTFSFDKDGIIEAYEKCLSTTGDSLDPKSYLLINNISICCWMRRQRFLDSYKYKFKGLEIFMKTPHPCTNGRCSCCCKKSKNVDKYKSLNMTAFFKSQPYTKNLVKPVNVRFQPWSRKIAILKANKYRIPPSYDIPHDDNFIEFSRPIENYDNFHSTNFTNITSIKPVDSQHSTALSVLSNQNCKILDNKKNNNMNKAENLTVPLKILKLNPTDDSNIMPVMNKVPSIETIDLTNPNSTPMVFNGDINENANIDHISESDKISSDINYIKCLQSTIASEVNIIPPVTDHPADSNLTQVVSKDYVTQNVIDSSCVLQENIDTSDVTNKAHFTIYYCVDLPKTPNNDFNLKQRVLDKIGDVPLIIDNDNRVSLLFVDSINTMSYSELQYLRIILTEAQQIVDKNGLQPGLKIQLLPVTEKSTVNNKIDNNANQCTVVINNNSPRGSEQPDPALDTASLSNSLVVSHSTLTYVKKLFSMASFQQYIALVDTEIKETENVLRKESKPHYKNKRKLDSTEEVDNKKSKVTESATLIPTHDGNLPIKNGLLLKMLTQNNPPPMINTVHTT